MQVKVTEATAVKEKCIDFDMEVQSQTRRATGVGIRASTAGSMGNFADTLRFVEEMRESFVLQKEMDMLEKAQEDWQMAREAIAECRNELRSATQRLEGALREAQARVGQLKDNSATDRELERVDAERSKFEHQAQCSKEAIQRALEAWKKLDEKGNEAANADLEADTAAEQTLPELRAAVALLTAATNVLFEPDGKTCRLSNQQPRKKRHDRCCSCLLLNWIKHRCCGHGGWGRADGGAGRQCERGGGGRVVGRDQQDMPQQRAARFVRVADEWINWDGMENQKNAVEMVW